jgi:DNA-binding response OmpR family regulator
VEVGLTGTTDDRELLGWGGNEPPGGGGGRNAPKVLVVEDDPTTVEILRYHLAEAGFDCVSGGTVDEGWRVLEADHPVLAIVDIRLPGAYGGKLLEMIRNDERFARMPVMVLTGLLDPEALEQAKRFGCEYMGKPFEPDELVSRVRRLVSVEPVAPMPMLASEPDRYVKMAPVRVLLLTDSYQITGNIHVSPKQTRFSDAWETLMRDGRSFIPVTDARVSRADGSQVIASPTFMEVSKADVRGICPVDKTVVDRAYREVIGGSHTRS